MPEASVIIPNYNHAPFLKERIDSVLQQSFRDMELIILDDASTDGSREIIESYHHHPLVSKIILNQQNSGSPFPQWSKGFSQSTGKWIWIAESDDRAAPDFLEKMLIAAKEKELAFIYCDSLIEKRGTVSGSFAAIKNQQFNTSKWANAYSANGKAEINESLKWECTINNASAVLFNRHHFEKAISHIAEFRYHGDWMLYLLLATAGDIAYLAETLNTYREHKQNHSASDPYQRLFKIEHFRILDYLSRQDFVTEKDKLFHHFLNRYTGFGFFNEPAFGKKGIYRHYKMINPQLARKTVAALLLNKLKRKKTG